ncbi:MAG: hypothetical protein A2Y21_07575 [Clostridiales bacterium GWC2_40_7]|nr:MAG: hypothetical protein A2Y21_07575 [Clostridiales bacterium GWC2_40_7]
MTANKNNATMILRMIIIIDFNDQVLKEENMEQKLIGLVDLTRFETGRPALVRELHGGHGMVSRLESMGIVQGSVVLKKSASLMHGPIILEKGTMQIAIGYEMAKGILVEPVE